jgi:Beta-lactamase class C and other penicillin binding proteins
MNKILSLFAGLVIFCAPVFSQNKAVADTLARIDSLLAHWNTHTPGGVLTIARGEKILYHKAAGMADLEHHIAITPNTIFEAGSVSKQFTATAILLLAEEGKLSLDDDVRKYIPELPDYGTVIKIRHMLAHTSGLKDWGSVAIFGGWPRGTRVYTQDHAREIIFRQKSLNFAPGTMYSYSNSNYTLLATIVERVSKESLAAFTRKHIFDRVGMHSTQWRDEFRKIVSGRAIAYEKKGRHYLQDMPFENTHGHAGLLTTTQDLLTWLRYWADGKYGRQLLTMREHQGVINDGSSIAYAEGAVRISEVNGVREVAHSGATAGYRAWMAYYPAKDLSVVYLSNDGSTVPTSSVGKKIAELFFGKSATTAAADTVKQPAFKPDMAAYKELAGRYYSEEADALFTVEVKDDKIVLFRSPATHLNLRAVATDTFEVANITIHFIRNKKKKVTGFTASVERAQNIVFNRLP